MKITKNKRVDYLPLYKQKDTYIASTLYAKGMKLDSTEWLNGACFFVFEDRVKCEEIEKKYYAGELKIDPRSLWQSFKTIKSIIFSKS